MRKSGKNAAFGVSLRETIRKTNQERREGRPEKEQIEDEYGCPVRLVSRQIQSMDVYRIVRYRGGMATGIADTLYH